MNEKPLTLAGRSNDLPLLPALYENFWRPRALSLMTGEDFSPRRELALVSEWAGIEPSDMVVDVGTSTGFYARGLTRILGRGPRVIALDHSHSMLAFASRAARREALDNVFFLRALAERLPFPEASVDVVLCGGSLNEFQSAIQALREMRRVLAADGRIVTMSLLAAGQTRGRWAQRFFGLSGIRFPTLAELNASVHEAGLCLVRQEIFGVVAFSRIEKENARN